MSNTKDYKLQYYHGISLEEYDQKLASQDGKCAICRQVTDKNLAVDHSHLSGKHRGLLCMNCNLALGHFEDDVARLEAAVRYLKGQS